MLGWKRDERRAYFEHDPGFLRAPLPLSPFRRLPGPGALAAPHEPFVPVIIDRDAGTVGVVSFKTFEDRGKVST